MCNRYGFAVCDLLKENCDHATFRSQHVPQANGFHTCAGIAQRKHY